VKYSSNVGLRTGVALGAVIIIVAAIVVSKRRSSGMGEATPAATEVSGAVSPAVEGAAVTPVEGTPALLVEGTPAVPVTSDDAADRAAAVKRRE